MFKFLRKYSTWIMAVGGTLLMITFLVPQAIQGLSQYSAQTGSSWATVGPDEETVTNGAYDIIQRQTRLIAALGPQNPLNQIGAGSNPAHWYLLVREASEAGLIPGSGAGITLAEAIALSTGDESLSGGVIIANLSARAGLTPNQTIATLADVVGVNRLMRLLAGSGRISDVRMRNAAAIKLLGVAADVVVVDARTNDSIETPSVDEEALAAQLAEYAAETEGEGDRGFGYRVPDRFKIEWLSIPKNAVEAAVEQSDALDPVTLRKAFLRDPAKFGAIGNLSTSTSGPSFDKYRERVRTRVLADETAKLTSNIAKYANDQLQFPRRGLATSGIHVDLPADWATSRLSLTDLATRLREQFAIDLPAYASSGGEWIQTTDLTDSDRFGDLGSATTNRFGRNPMQTPRVVDAIKEFGGNDTVPVQAGLAFPPLSTLGGDLFIARVIETDPSREPKDLAEVREKVTADLEAIFRFDSVVEQLPELLSTARADGLRSVATAFDSPVSFAPDIREVDLNVLLQFGVSISGRIPGIGSDPTAVKAVIEYASLLDPTAPMSDQPIEKRLFAVPLPDQLKILFVDVDRVSPLTKEQWTDLAGNDARLQRAIAQDMIPEDPAALFGFDALVDRHNFAFTRASSNDEFADDTDDDTTS